jgi:hypothetical protein
VGNLTLKSLVMDIIRKKCKVVAIPKEDGIFINTNIDPNGKGHLYVISEDRIEKGDWCLYLNYDPKVDKNQIWQVKGSLANEHLFRKIVATTDTSLKIEVKMELYDNQGISWGEEKKLVGLPRISEDLLNLYRKGKYDEISVKYVTYSNSQTFYTVPKVNVDNTLDMSLIKKSWDRNEVKGLLNDFAASLVGMDARSSSYLLGLSSKFIEEHL